MTKEEQKEYHRKYYLENKNKINERLAKRRDEINEYSRKYYSQKKQRLAELENQITDLKANCDLAIEGRDVEIFELKDRLAEEVELHLHAEEYIKELEQQIEKMKCCENCKHKKSEVDRCELLMYTMNACLCKNKDKWEIKEND